MGLAPMSKPREVIARAIAASNIGYDAWNELTNSQYRRYSEMADAVIDALVNMPVTDAMQDAAFKWEGGDEHVAVLWRAMVGAMRDERVENKAPRSH